MNPTDDPDIVPVTDGGGCQSSILYTPVGYGPGCDADCTYDWPWTDPPDTLDTDGDPE